MAEQYKEQHRQQETEWEKLEEETSELQGQIVILCAHSEADLYHLQEKKRGQSRSSMSWKRRRVGTMSLMRMLYNGKRNVQPSWKIPIH